MWSDCIRTLIGFKSKPDYPQRKKGETFYFVATFQPADPAASSCYPFPISRHNYGICYKNRISLSFFHLKLIFCCDKYGLTPEPGVGDFPLRYVGLFSHGNVIKFWPIELHKVFCWSVNESGPFFIPYQSRELKVCWWCHSGKWDGYGDRGNWGRKE